MSLREAAGDDAISIGRAECLTRNGAHQINTLLVTPAKAGVQGRRRGVRPWIPAFALKWSTYRDENQGDGRSGGSPLPGEWLGWKAGSCCGRRPRIVPLHATGLEAAASLNQAQKSRERKSAFPRWAVDVHGPPPRKLSTPSNRVRGRRRRRSVLSRRARRGGQAPRREGRRRACRGSPPRARRARQGGVRRFRRAQLPFAVCDSNPRDPLAIPAPAVARPRKATTPLIRPSGCHSRDVYDRRRAGDEEQGGGKRPPASLLPPSESVFASLQASLSNTGKKTASS
jgi:hypothetical protein